MAAADSERVLEAKKLAKVTPSKAEALYKDIISKPPTENSDAAIREYEVALISLGELYRDQQNTNNLVELITQSRTVLSTFVKAKTAKLVRQLLDLFHDIPNTLDIQIATTKSCIEWATSKRRGFLRQSLEIRLVSLYMAIAKIPGNNDGNQKALKLVDDILPELKRLDDKLVLVEAYLLESRIHHAMKNVEKAKNSLSSARTSSTSVYTPPLLHAKLDMQAGILNAEDKKFDTAFGYFVEALDGYHTQNEPVNATAALQYMLLCKVMLNLPDDVNKLMASKQAVKYPGQSFEAMKAISRALTNRSLREYDAALVAYEKDLSSDAFTLTQLRLQYDAMFVQNLIKVTEPYSCVEIDHVASLVGVDKEKIKERLRTMINDKDIKATMDGGAGCLTIFDETERDESYEAALAIIAKLSNVVDILYTTKVAVLE